MFKNLRLYRLTPATPATPDALDGLDDALAAHPFTPCGNTQPTSSGWVPPRGQAYGPLVEHVGAHRLAELTVERRLLPAAVVRRHVEQLAQRVEKETGRKPGRKLVRDLKDQAVLELLPQAFTNQASHRIWIDTRRGLLAIDAASPARADDVVTHLIQAVPGLAVAPLATALSPATAMAQWLADADAPRGFAIDSDCELKAADPSQAAVRYARHRLDIDEVREHIEAGKLPTRLALTWAGRISFVLSDIGQIRRIAFLDGVLEKRPRERPDDDGFDADAAIVTGELARLIDDLLEALGGEQVPGSAADGAPALLEAA